MKTEHTLGNWEFKRANDGLIAFRISGNGFILADVLFRHTTEHAVEKAEAEANARLIAAAPCLLRALEAVSRLDYLNEHNALAEQARAALTKARGEA